MTTLKQFLAELTYIQIKEISRHAKGLLLALEKSNRKEFLDYPIITPQSLNYFTDKKSAELVDYYFEREKIDKERFYGLAMFIVSYLRARLER